MTRRALWFLIKLGVLGAVVAYFTANPGRATIEFLGWRADMPVGVLVLAIVVLAGLLAYGGRLRRAIAHLPGRYRRYRDRSRQAKGYRALTQGLVAAAAGDANEASRQARRAQALIEDPALTRLLAAQAAQLNGEDDAATRYFESMTEDAETAFLGVRGLMTQALKAGDKARALELAERADRLRPNTPWVLRELLALQVEAGRDEDALATLDRAQKAKAIPAEEAERRRGRLLLETARQKRREGHPRAALKTAERALKADGASVEAVRLAATLMRDEGRAKRALKLVEESWEKAPDPALADLYRELAPAGTSALEQVKRFESLLARNREHPESHLALAETALDAQLWGTARHHLEIAAGHGTSPRVCRLMARLEEEERGDLEAARTWLARAVGDEATGEDDADEIASAVAVPATDPDADPRAA